jgi:hypothetical protein
MFSQPAHLTGSAVKEFSCMIGLHRNLKRPFRNATRTSYLGCRRRHLARDGCQFGLVELASD